MKKIIYLGVALVSFVNVSTATGQELLENQDPEEKIIVLSPLAIAIQNDDIEFVKRSIEYGADLNECSEYLSPLMIAARYNKVNMVKFLLVNGANPRTKDKKGFTALKYAQISNANETVEILKKILQG